MSPETLLPAQAGTPGTGTAPGAGSQAPTADIKPGDSWSAYSPNVDEGLNFEQAYSRLGSQNQAAFRSIAADVLNSAGLKDYDLHDAVGDWSDGAENSVFQVIRKPPDPETSKYLAAWHGLLGNQKAVLHFAAGEKGPDSVYQIYIPDRPASELRKELDAYGIQFRTIVPKQHGHVVVLYDEGRSLRPNVSQFAEANHATVREAIGKGDFIGGPTRTEARAKYRQIIKAYERSRGKVRPGAQPPDGPDNADRASEPKSLYQHSARPARRVRMAAGKSPEGGMAVRGVFYPGGKFIPDMPAPNPLDSEEGIGYNTQPDAQAPLTPPASPPPVTGPSPQPSLAGRSAAALGSQKKLATPQPFQFEDDEHEQHFAAVSGHWADELSKHLVLGKVSEQNVRQYTASAHNVWKNMPKEALSRFRDGVEKYQFFPTTKDLTEWVLRTWPVAFGHITSTTHTVGGLYHDGAIIINGGGGVNPFPPQFKHYGSPENGGLNKAEHVYAHEFSHAIDGHHFELSGSVPWHHAWTKDILGGKLTRYAENNRSEGFAEFGRLLYTRHMSPEYIARLFPRAAAFFQERGLWPSSPPQTAAPKA